MAAKMQSIRSPEPGSFRDRTGRVFYSNGRVLRGLNASALENWQTLAATRFFAERTDRREIIPTQISANAARSEWVGTLEHERIAFVSYPHEWPFGMLKQAALLQLGLLRDALKEGMILKDATPYNIQWQGHRPVFIDIPSFEKLRPGEPWVGYKQFCQMFLYPLMLQAYRGLPPQPWFRAYLDGLEPEFVRRLLSRRDFLRRGVFTHVYLQALLSRQDAAPVDQRKELRKAGFATELIENNARGLTRIVERLQWKQAQSTWSDYAEGGHSYTDNELQLKGEFVEKHAAAIKPGLVWDLGCNTGHFSKIVSKSAKYVLAIDGDHLAIERLFHQLHANGPDNILPLVMNLTDPSPALGWRNKERKTLEERGTPDLVLALALIHHIVISGNIPLAEFADWLWNLKSAVIIEFPTRADEMVLLLLRNRVDQYEDYSLENFESQMKLRFNLKESILLKNGKRKLYFATPRRQ